MPTNTESLNRELFRLLSKYKPKPLDAAGKATPVPDEADIFKFEFTKDGEDYGTVYVTLDDERVLTVYFGDDVTESPDDKTPGLDYDDTWSGLLHQLSAWRMTKGLRGFKTQNKDRVGDDMARRNHMRNKDKIAEGYYPMGKKASYSDAVPSVKIVIEHSRVIEEGEQRYRNINRIFLENQLGERYLLDTKKPGIARVYARHIAEGGKVNDDRWSHIGSLCEEYQKMAGFVRATRNGQFNESAQSLVNEGIAHYESLRESLSRLTGKRGYNSYFENWTPSLMEDGTEENNLNELFVQETLDPRIESVMPILNRIHKKVSESTIDKEINKLAEWADSLTEEESIKSNNPVGIPEDEEFDEDSHEEQVKRLAAYNEKMAGENPPIDLGLREVGNWAKVGHHGDPIKTAWYNIAKYGIRQNRFNNSVEKVMSAIGEFPDLEDEVYDMYDINQDEVDALYHAYETVYDQYDQLQGQQGMSEDLDANQKRVGQLGPTEKVKNNNIGKLVGANENFINSTSQAVTTEEDEMAEGVLDAIKKGVAGVKQFGKDAKAAGKEAWDEVGPMLKQDWKHPIQAAMAKEGEMDEGEHTQHYHDANKFTGDIEHGERPPTDWSVDPIEAGTDRIHQKISGMLKKLSKPKDKQELDEVDTGEYDARKSTHKDNPTPEQEKEFRKKVDAYGKELEQRQKEKVKEGQEDLDAILRIIRK